MTQLMNESVSVDMLIQKKLTKDEWVAIETPVSSNEKFILNMMVSIDINNINRKTQKAVSLLSLIKIDKIDNTIVYYLFKKYFEKYAIDKNLISINQINHDKKFHLNKAQQIRLNNLSMNNLNLVFEMKLLDCIEKIIQYKKNNNEVEYLKYKYTLIKLIQQDIYNTNTYVLQICNEILEKNKDTELEIMKCIQHADYICDNEIIKNNSSIGLYDHQKRIILECSNPSPKCIFYTASTGTGKTLTPICLLQQGHKIVFVCGAKHVGLSLAKSAISCHRKIAFAYGCNSSNDIRLHYFSAKEYTKNWKSGAIYKVDNSVGDKVELMICDIQSYVHAMNYMKAFNSLTELIMFWDEPTITMDYENHTLHDLIQSNWRLNEIPNIILSSATLPKQHELNDMIVSFKSKFGFDEARIVNIESHDFTKTIPILDVNGFAVVPHLTSNTYKEFIDMIQYCKENTTILRYISLKEIQRLFIYLNDWLIENYQPMRVFNNLNDVSISLVKTYYIECCELFNEEMWLSIKTNLLKDYNPVVKLNTLVDKDGVKLKKNELPTVSNANRFTTMDAYTLTDGPTIYLCKDAEKVAVVLLNELKIPSQVIKDVSNKINSNNELGLRILKIEKEIDYLQSLKENKDEDKVKNKREMKVKQIDEDKQTGGKSIGQLKSEYEVLISSIQITRLPDIFIPNSIQHQDKWSANKLMHSFVSDVEDNTITKIMSIHGIDDFYKLLLLSGIGVFGNGESCKNAEYTEIMKKLADEKRLYLILADSDYIYGTNYSFSHGVLGKDMIHMSQEKIIQAIGRVGRMQSNDNSFSVRLRDDQFIRKIFIQDNDKIEARIMNKLLNDA